MFSTANPKEPQFFAEHLLDDSPRDYPTATSAWAEQPVEVFNPTVNALPVPRGNLLEGGCNEACMLL